MNSYASVYYLDTSVLLPLLDKRALCVPKEQVREIRRFEQSIINYNVKIKIPILVLGETLLKVKERTPAKGALEIFDALLGLQAKIGERMELCSLPRLRGAFHDYTHVLQRLIEADDWLRDNPTDVHVLAQAILDEEADILYTTDTTLLLSGKIKEAVSRLREEKGYKHLKISLPT